MATEPAKAIPTGLPNEVYDLVLVLQQAAADTVRYDAFAEDARAAGDEELASWFGELADSDREIVERARTLLLPRLGAGGGSSR
jgi:hypothetical protein